MLGAESTALLMPQGLSQWTFPLTSSGIEPEVFRLVAKCLNQLRYSVPHKILNKH
jgi:hypothetical protein